MENDNEECYYFERLERVLATQVDTFDIVIWVNSSSRFGHRIIFLLLKMLRCCYLLMLMSLFEGDGQTEMESSQNEAEI